MAIITISKGSFTHGREVAETLAAKLGYKCFSREILLEASKQFNIPEIKLVEAIENAPSFLDRITRGKKKYITYIRPTFLKHLQKDNIVYHGFAGHFFIKDVPNVLKVRIIANYDYRVRIVMSQEGITADKARNHIEKIDAARSKWSRHLYGIDTRDPDLYDIVFRIDNMTVENVVDNIANTIQLPCFQISSKSRNILNDLALEAEVEANLVEFFPETKNVSVKDGVVTIIVEIGSEHRKRVDSEIKKILKKIDGVIDFEINFEIPPIHTIRS